EYRETGYEQRELRVDRGEGEIAPGQSSRGRLVRKDGRASFPTCLLVALNSEFTPVAASPLIRRADRKRDKRLRRPPFHPHCRISQPMGRVQKCTALTAGEIMNADVRVGPLLDEVRVMMGIAGQDEAHVMTSRRPSAIDARKASRHDQRCKCEVQEFGDRPVPAIRPDRLTHTENDIGAVSHDLLSDVLEEADLGLVDIAIELDIPSAQPPIVRQLEHEVTACLARLASANHPARTCCASVFARMAPTEQTRKGGK